MDAPLLRYRSYLEGPKQVSRVGRHWEWNLVKSRRDEVEIFMKNVSRLSGGCHILARICNVCHVMGVR
jgi:hypothetical protein